MRPWLEGHGIYSFGAHESSLTIWNGAFMVLTLSLYALN